MNDSNLFSIDQLAGASARNRINRENMNEIMYRGIRDIIHERNITRSECQIIMINCVGNDIAKLITAYAYGDEQNIPDIAAHNLTKSGKIRITAGDYQIIWDEWNNWEIFQYMEHMCGYLVERLDSENEYGIMCEATISMFSMIELITTGVSSHVFEKVYWILYKKTILPSAYYNPKSEDEVCVLNAMQQIRAQFLENL